MSYPRGSRPVGGGRRQMSDVEKVYHMLKPRPKPLLVGRRALVRHGELIYFSPNTVSKKPRYFFLFSDVLLLTKRTQQAKFHLKIYIHLRGSVRVVPLKNSPSYEFRLLVAERGTLKKRKERRIILFGKNEAHKQAWMRDIQHCIWEANGKRGPDPSGIDRSQGDPREDEDEEDEEEEEPQPQRQRPRNQDKNKKKKPTEQHPEVESLDDLSYDSSSGDEDEGVSGEGSNPLIIFDPFDEAGDKKQGSTDSFGMQPFSGQDSQVPKGVMLAPLGSDSSQYGLGGYGAQGQYPGVGGYGAQGQYGVTGYGAGGQYGMMGAYPGMGAYGMSGYFDPTATGLGSTSTTPLSGGFGSTGSLSGGITGSTPLSGGSTFSPVTTGSASAFAGGTSLFAGQGVGTFDPRFGQDNLYGAAKDTTTALSGMLGTQDTSTAKAPEYAGPDLDQVAQRELQEATRAIEEIARHLASRPRKVKDAAPDAPVTVDHVSDAILDGAQAIARAASILLKAASEAQQERVNRDVAAATQNAKAYHPDPVWANGLISAAREVVATTQHLVVTANSATQGQAQEGALVACARAVAASTTHLVAAERAKADLASPTHRGLEEAAKGISKATNQLVQAAQMASASQGGGQASAEGERNRSVSMTEKKIAEIEAQTRILALEAETQRAREQLLQLRKEDYKGK